MIIFGKKATIHFGPTENDDAGGIDLETFKICINPKSKDKHQVILHEAFHGLLHRLGLSGHIDENLEEVLVDCFSTLVVENYTLKPKWKMPILKKP